MRAAVLRVLGRPLEVERLELPRLAEGQVLVRMQLAAVCQSQRLEVSGVRGPDPHLPHLIGHEGIGEVADVGPGVTKVAPEDQVVLSWIRGSGRPGAPVAYGSPRGVVNAGPIATFCEMPVVAEQCVTRIAPPVDPAVGVLAGCALPTGAGTVWNAMAPRPDGRVCIIGLGGVGLAAVAGAAYAGWGQIVAVDLKPGRLQRARALGATETIDAGAEDLDAAAARLTNGAGFDLVVECAGAVAAMEAAVRLARPRGGRVIIAGNLEAGQTIRIDPFDLIRGRWVGGTWGGGIDPDADIPRIVRLVETNALDHRLLTGPTFPLEAVNEAIAALGADDPGRPLIAFS